MRAILSNMGVLTMNVFLSAGAACAMMLVSTVASAQTLPTKPGTNNSVITISCFRGPWQDVIWDRPEPVFVDSLVAAGYTFPEAHAISERVCRDIDGVDDPGHSRAVLAQIFRDTPPHSSHRHMQN